MATDLLELSASILDGSASIDSHHPLRMSRDSTLQEVADRVAFVEAFANVVAIDTDEGLVLIDAAGPLHAGSVHDAIRGWTDGFLHTAVFTHGHVDHIYAVRNFESEPDAPAARVIGHEALPDRFRRYEMTNGYNAVINQRQFQLGAPIFPGGYRYPDETYRDHLDITVGGVDLHLRHDRGETDDGTWVWLAEQRIVCTGDLFIWASPNCGNPQKVQRYPADWARAMRKMADLGPELLLPGHGLPIAGADRVRSVLSDTAELLESLVDQTLSMMNEGARLDEIVHAVAAPAHLLDRPWLQPVYDEPEFVVHNLWRLYGGWYDGDPSHLKPAPAADLAAEVAQLAGGAAVLAERAQALSDAGDHRLAGHLAELAAQAAPGDPGVHRIRSSVFARRAAVERSTMAIGVFRWAASESEELARPGTPPPVMTPERLSLLPTSVRPCHLAGGRRCSTAHGDNSPSELGQNGYPPDSGTATAGRGHMITRHSEMFDVEAHDVDDRDEQPLFGVKPQPPVLSSRPSLFAVEPSDEIFIDLTA